jgi:riboflavin kinase / FMN adenylyltransferase
MKVFTEAEEIKNNKNAVVTVGSFDGLHLGHIKILNKVNELAKSSNCSSAVVTFDPHPRYVLSQNYEMKILTSLDEKKEIFEKLGIDNLMVINFTKDFSQLTSDEFIKKFILQKIGASHMVIGHDHKFGKDRLGDEQKLREVGKQYNFDVTAVAPENLNDEIISSTKVRRALVEGDVEKAEHLLGRKYSITGAIVLGAQRGRVLGFPTANTKLFEDEKAVPANGVYVVDCFLDYRKYFGIMNIGYRPTFENKHELVLETHILNFSGDIYGKTLKIEFLKRLRDEKKFESRDALIHQIEYDKNVAQRIINSL